MNISNRMFSYPMLSENQSGYVNSKFDVDFSYSLVGIQYLHINLNVLLENIELEQQINIGNAQIFLHAECSTSGFRKMYNLTTGNNDFDIEISKLNGKVELVALIIVTKSIKGFASADFETDYSGIGFDFNKGSILAYKNIEHLTITKQMEEFKTIESIIAIRQQLADQEIPISVEMNQPKIVILVGKEQHALYYNNIANQSYRNVLNSLLILPALIYVFEELKVDGALSDYEEKEWFLALEKNFESRGIDFKEKINEDDAMALAQEVMNLPITKAFEFLPMINADFEGAEDED